MEHVNRFDALRLIAAWLVLLDHSYPLSGSADVNLVTRWLRLDTGGGLGVAIFFAVSGYLVTISYENCNSVAVFIKRRMLRIYPALVVLSLLSVLVLGPMLTNLSLADYLHHPLTLKFLSTARGFDMFITLPGVFDGNPISAVNGSLWSLPYELGCYLSLVAIALIPMTLRIKAGLSVGVLLVLLMTRPLVPPTSPYETYFGLDHYATQLGLIFAVGALLATFRKLLSRRLWNSIGLFSGIGLCVAWNLPFGKGPIVLYSLCIAGAVLWLALFGRWLPIIPEKIGDLSYGTYLYGFPVQQCLTHAHIAAYGIEAFIIASTACTLVVAALSWHLIEKPFMRLKRSAWATATC
ncbi:MAG: acyltransferase [Betaproteobacteria bacterium]